MSNASLDIFIAFAVVANSEVIVCHRCVFKRRLPTNFSKEGGGESYSRCFDAIGVFLGGDDNCVLFHILLNSRNAKVYEEDEEESSLENHFDCNRDLLAPHFCHTWWGRMFYEQSLQCIEFGLSWKVLLIFDVAMV